MSPVELPAGWFKPVPDYFEPITAYRMFDVYPNGLLVGQAHAEPWPTYAPFVARCGFVHPDGYAQHLDERGAFQEAPVFKCDCGIHVIKTHEGMIARRDKDWLTQRGSFLSFWGEHYRPAARAWGTVKIWGRIVEHETGYRAQFAYPASLACDDEQAAVRVATLYGVPCWYEAKPSRPKEEDWGVLFSFPSFLSPSSVAPSPIVKPTYVPPQVRTIAAPAVVGASKWEIKHYGQLKDGPKVDVPEDWRAVLRQMVYLDVTQGAKALDALKADILSGGAGYQIGATVKVKAPSAFQATDKQTGLSIKFLRGYVQTVPSAASQGVKRP